MNNCSSKKELIISAWFHNILEYSKDTSILNYISNVLPNDINSQNVIRLISNWNNPGSYDEFLISQADRLSRGSSEIYKPEAPGTFHNAPVLLKHLVSTLQIPEREKPKEAYCKFAPLENDGILPVQKESYSTGKTDYQNLWSDFEKNLKSLKGLEYDRFLQSLNSLLERYWWCIPSANSSESESLYQHSKMTVALATVIYEYQKITNTENEQELKNYNALKFRFIKGDISGIQKYIFDLKTTKNNAKLLRAKSFQIAALGEVLSEFLIKQFDVTYANIIMSAGGNFMLLIPNTEKATLLLPQLQLEIESYFMREYAGKLAVIVSDGVTATSTDLLKENVQDLMNRIGEDADTAKQKKMQKALRKNGAILSDFYRLLQQYGECPKCGVFPASGIDENGDPCECADCQKLTEVGGNLIRAGSVLYYSDSLEAFSKIVKVSAKADITGGSTVNTFVPGKPVKYLPYTAPRNEKGEIITFEEIAARSNGNTKLAMFKSDIDNLGLVFSSSLGERMSFSRYADLSHQLHYFFSAYYAWYVTSHSYIQNGIEKPYSDVIYTVFSGGDDLCILGAWDAILQFASDFEAELNKFTNNNPSVTLSGGITLTSHNVPVRNIAANAEENLEVSKDRKENGKTVKNAITVFGTTVAWKDYRKCLENGQKLESYLDKNEISTSVVYKLIDFANRAEKVKKGDVSELIKSAPNTHDRIWKSNFKYIVARNINAGKKENLYNWFLQFGSSQEEIIKSRIAVSYALYTQRNK